MFISKFIFSLVESTMNWLRNLVEENEFDIDYENCVSTCNQSKSNQNSADKEVADTEVKEAPNTETTS